MNTIAKNSLADQHRNLTYSILGSGSASGADGSGGTGPDWDDPGLDDLSPDFTRFIPYPGELRQVPTWEVILKIVFYTFIMVIAVLGNLAVVIIVARNKRMWTTTNYYIVNLAVSDLMVTLTCTWVYLVDDLTEGWILGAFFCKFDSFAQGQCYINYFIANMLALLFRMMMERQIIHAYMYICTYVRGHVCMYVYMCM